MTDMGDESRTDFESERRRYLGLPQIPAGIHAPFQSHSDTSIAAAQAIDGQVSRLQRRVLDFIQECGTYGATDEEIQVGLSLNPSTERPRRIELLAMHLIRDNGKRKTRSGRQATVWCAC